MNRVAGGLRALAITAALGCSRTPSTTQQGPTGVASANAVVPPPDLIVLHGSDLRGQDAPSETAAAPGGLARRATLVDLARAESGAVLQLDAGDFLPPRGDPATAEAGERRALRVLAAYRRMGVDVITPGENELAFGVERLRAWLKEANITAVAENLTDTNDQPLFEGGALVTRKGHTTGVFGVLDFSAARSASDSSGWRISDPATAVRRAVRSLRDRGAELVVALVHTDGGPARVDAILGTDSEVDLVVLGHAPPGTAASRRVGRTEVVYAGGAPPSAGRVDISWSAAAARVVLRPRLVPISESVRKQLGVSLLAAVDDPRVRRDEEAFARPKSKSRRDGPATAEPLERWEYASTEGCALCHTAAFEQWKTTDHAHALATLAGDGHDKDAGCLGCHLTGYLQPGGSQLLAIATTQFANVGCECCHGASVAHVRSLDKKKGTTRTVARTVCLGCHTADRAPFDYDEALKRVLGPGHVAR